MNKRRASGFAWCQLPVPPFVQERLKREQQRTPFVVRDRVTPVDWKKLMKRAKEAAATTVSADIAV